MLDAGYVLLDTPFDGLAPILGVKGVSFAVALVSAALVSGTTSLIVGGSVLLISVLLGLIEFTERVDPRQIGIVQVNIPLTDKFEMARRGESFQLYEDLSKQLSPQDLVVWSEAAFATRQPVMLEALQRVRRATDHRYVASGYVEFADDGPFNSLIVAGDENANYRKLRLVPFGEYVPFESFLRSVLTWIDVPYSNLQPSRENTRTVSVAHLKLAPAICYEASFEEDVRDAVRQSGADAILVVSEDAWFGDSLAPHQNFEMARMRAREHGRYVIRAANSGISGIVGPNGKVIARAERFVRTTVEGEIFTMRGSTPYTTYGAYLLYAMLLLGVLSSIACRYIGSRQAAR